MRLRDTFSTAVLGVRRNIGRSLLTMLGIIIGVGSVVLMSAVGASMEGVILGQISTLGPTSMVIFPGSEEGGANAVSTGFDSLTLEDLAALERLPSIESLAPVIFVPGVTTTGDEEESPQVFGVRPQFFQNQSIKAKEGRLIDASDDQGARFVAVLGADPAEELFGQQDPLGKRIRIGENTYTVIGIAESIGSQFFQNADDRIYVPLNVAKTVTGQKYLNYITMQASGSFEAAFADVKDLLRRRHGIVNPEDDSDKDGFMVRSSEQANDILSGVSVGLTLFITAIATISLIVGGIGIMNIMLVSVTERTREIGLRKAVGATRGDLLRQFLIEAILLTVTGGIIGVVLGVSLAFVLAQVANRFLATYLFALSPQAMVAALVMAFATGIAFGISPARKAAALDPIDALRYE